LTTQISGGSTLLIMAANEELSSTSNTSVLSLEVLHGLRLNNGNVVLVDKQGNKLLYQLVPSPSSKEKPVPIQVNLLRGDVTMPGRKIKGRKAGIVNRRNKNRGTSNKSRKRLKQDLTPEQIAKRKAQSERDKAAHALKSAKAPAATKVKGHSPKASVKTFKAPPPKNEAAQAVSDPEVFHSSSPKTYAAALASPPSFPPLELRIGTRVWFCNLSYDHDMALDYGKLNGKPGIVRGTDGLGHGQLYVEPDHDSCGDVRLYAPNGDRRPVPWRMSVFNHQVSFDRPGSF